MSTAATVKGQYHPYADPHIPYTPPTREVAFYDARYGGGGGTVVAYVHTQGSGATTWTINHNLGYKPQIESFTTGGLKIEGDVLHVSNTQATIGFSAAQAGFARCL